MLRALRMNPVTTPARALYAVRVNAVPTVMLNAAAISGKSRGTNTSITFTAKTDANKPRRSNLLGGELTVEEVGSDMHIPIESSTI
jgi:hypothetical protein